MNNLVISFLLLLGIQLASGQCNTGTSTELVVNGNFSAGNTGFSSAYTYGSGAGSLEPENVYAITTDPHLNHPGAVSYHDHTTGTGNMMAINGASTPVDFWCETVTVLPNTNYNFSAWFSDWSSDSTDNLPILQFEVNGVLFGPVFNFPLHDGTWVEFFATWYSGSNTSATICINDQQTAGYGNDFAMDDVSFKGCSCNADSAALSIHANPPSPVCTGSSSQLNLVVDSGTILWQSSSDGVNFTTISGATDTSYSAHVAQTTTYRAIVQTTGCNDTSVSYTLVTDSLPVINFGDDTTYCSAFIRILTTGNAGTVWSTGVTAPQITVDSAGTYWASIHNVCGTASDTITFGQPSTVSISTATSIFCAGDSSQICATTGFVSYQWNVGDTGACIEAYEAGNYYVTATDVHGCTVESNHVPISVYQVPSVSILVQGDSLSSFGAVSYQWYFNNLPIPDATKDSYVAIQTGLYSLQITDDNGCTNISNPFEFTVTATGIAELNSEHISVFPNPSTGTWQLTTSVELIGSKLEVTDAEGRVVFRSEISDLQSTINLNVARGIYWLRINSADQSKTIKLVKF